MRSFLKLYCIFLKLSILYNKMSCFGNDDWFEFLAPGTGSGQVLPEVGAVDEADDIK